MTMGTIYQDMAKRTGGKIYIGVVGPVRTGKSTFIRRFMDVMVLPHVAGPFEKERIMDELPQSGEGKTISTTEPKFVPAEAVDLTTERGAKFSIRMVDCVGYLIPGVLGHEEDGNERMVHTPWAEEQMTFREAAKLGTEKVIHQHAVVGLVVTTDGSFGELPRRNYVEAESQVVRELKALKKPFIILLNTVNPETVKTKELVRELEEKYETPVLAVNCQKLTAEGFNQIFEKMVWQFPAIEVDFRLPGYLEALPSGHWIKETLVSNVRLWMEQFETIGEVLDTCTMMADGKIVKEIKIIKADMGNGIVSLEPVFEEGLYYTVVGELLGEEVNNDRQMFLLMKEYAIAKMAYDNMKDALKEVETEGYGIMAPKLSEMVLEKPEVFKQGSKYGVRMYAKAPCLHIIRTDISTEVSPVVGTERQSEDLANYLIEQFGNEETDIWETNLFGKSLKEMVTEQMESKVSSVPDSVKGKVQRSLQKISDEGKDYFICIIL